MCIYIEFIIMNQLFTAYHTTYFLNNFRWFRKKPTRTKDKVPFPPLAGYEEDPNRNTTVVPYLEILLEETDDETLSSDDVLHQGLYIIFRNQNGVR